MNNNSQICNTAAVTLLQCCDDDLLKLKQRVGVDRALSTYTRQCGLRQLVASFIADAMGQADVLLESLTAGFIHDFADYLSVRRQLRGGTVWLACLWLKGVVGRACQRGLLMSNPFAAFHIGRNIREREYLTEEELHLMATCQLSDERTALYRDLFVFAALTGMAFADICQLRRSDIRQIDGMRWVMAKRKKTKTTFRVRLLPQAETIIKRYEQDGEYIFGPITYRTLAKHIPLIVRRCGIDRHVTFHCARHTFAVMSLNAGVPMESVSRMLGHTNISTTQIYARVTMKKLSSDMDKLQQHLVDI